MTGSGIRTDLGDGSTAGRLAHPRCVARFYLVFAVLLFKTFPAFVKIFHLHTASGYYAYKAN